MTTPAPAPDTTPPERILPTEPGWWLEDAADGRLMAREIVADGDSLIVWDDQGEVEWPGWRWLAPIPTPEQLAARAAQLAAGQELADALRASEAAWAGGTWERVFSLRERDAEVVLLAAFPPGGAR